MAESPLTPLAALQQMADILGEECTLTIGLHGWHVRVGDEKAPGQPCTEACEAITAALGALNVVWAERENLHGEWSRLRDLLDACQQAWRQPQPTALDQAAFAFLRAYEAQAQQAYSATNSTAESARWEGVLDTIRKVRAWLNVTSLQPMPRQED